MVTDCQWKTEIHGGALSDTPSSSTLWIPGEQHGDEGSPVLAWAIHKTGMLSLLFVILGLLMLDLNEDIDLYRLIGHSPQSFSKSLVWK